MRPHQVAELIHVSTATVRRWAREEYSDFLSPDAQSGGAGQRSFSQQDARILGWIARMRADGDSPATIAATLKSAQADDWRGLPQLPGMQAPDETVAMIPIEAVKARLEAMQGQIAALERERDDLRERLSRSESLNAELQRKQSELADRLLSLNDRLASLLEHEQRRRK